jgi:hypothetical protein
MNLEWDEIHQAGNFICGSRAVCVEHKTDGFFAGNKFVDAQNAATIRDLALSNRY